MALDYEGEIVCEINGQEVEIISFDETVTNNTTVVKTMNSTGRAKGTRRGIELTDISLTAPAPIIGEFNWRTLKNARIVTYPFGFPAKRTTYMDCTFVSRSKKYSVDGEQARDIKLTCLRVEDPA